MAEPARCVATEARIRWALLRTGWPQPWHFDLGDLSMGHARILAREAGVPLAALYVPDPSRWELFRAWLHGKLRRDG